MRNTTLQEHKAEEVLQTCFFWKHLLTVHESQTDTFINPNLYPIINLETVAGATSLKISSHVTSQRSSQSEQE